MSEKPETAITSVALLQAVYDHQRAFDTSTGWARISLRTPWQILRDVYPEEVVDAAYTREASLGNLEYGTCGCSPHCDLCARTGPPTRITEQGHANLIELKAGS